MVMIEKSGYKLAAELYVKGQFLGFKSLKYDANMYEKNSQYAFNIFLNK